MRRSSGDHLFKKQHGRTLGRSTLRAPAKTRQRGYTLVVGLLLLAVLMVLSTSVALHLGTNAQNGTRWNDRQQALQTANAAAEAAQTAIAAVIKASTSDAAVITQVATVAGFYSSPTNAPTWYPWPSTGVVTVQPFSTLPSAQYYVVYQGMSPTSIKTGSELISANAGTTTTSMVHHFAIFVHATGTHTGVQVTLEVDRQVSR